MNTLGQRYDTVPYYSRPDFRAHPATIGSISILNGHPAPDPTTGRILELGCGDGQHLIAIAARYPESQCIGIDVSPEAINRASQAASAHGIQNCSFIAADFRAEAVPPHSFDYVIAHGIASWVAPATRLDLWTYLAQCLSPRGAAMVSYNLAPSWHLRHLLRDLCLMVTPQSHSEVASRRRDLLSLLDAVLDADGCTEHDSLRRQIRQLLSYPDWFLEHDLFAPENHPLSLVTCVQEARRAGLEYSGDSDIASSWMGDMPQQLRSDCQLLATDELTRAALGDALQLRMLRCSIFRTSAAPTAHAEPSSSIPLGPPACWLRRRHDITLETARRALQSSNRPLIALNDYLANHAPSWIDGDSLKAELFHNERVADEEAFRKAIMLGVSSGLFEIQYFCPAPIASTPSTHPQAWWYARSQARTSTMVATLHCRSTELLDDEREVIQHLDGTKTIATIGDLLPQLGLESVEAIVSQLCAQGLVVGP